MVLANDDFVKETSTTTGTGTYTLAGAVVGFQSFAAVGDANTCHYSATDGTDWETGIGTYTLAGTTLARTTVLASSNADAAVNWGAGTKTLVIAPLSSQTGGASDTWGADQDSAGFGIDDANANELIAFATVVSAVNELTITNAAAGNGPDLSATGDDTNIDLNVSPKGAGNIVLGTFTLDADQSVGAGQDNYVLTYDDAAGTIGLELAAGGGSDTWGADQQSAGYGIDDANGLSVLAFEAVSSAVNYLSIKNNITAQSPIIEAKGPGTDIGLILQGKGAGKVIIDQGHASNRFTFANTGMGNFNIALQSAAPSGLEIEHDIYLDDGTNTGSGSPGWRRYTGSAWEDIGALSGGGGSDTWGADQDSAGFGIDDTNGNELLSFVVVASAVNEVTIVNAATGNPAEIRATGGDTNIDLKLDPKGTGTVTIDQATPFNLSIQSSEPGSPSTGDVYIDDGTNTAHFYPAMRRYNGSSWVDLGGSM